MENLLVYSKPAERFIDALVLGNGSLGATVYGDPKKDRISLNLDTLWSGTPTPNPREGAYDAFIQARALALDGKLSEAQALIEDEFNSSFSQAYLPMGNLFIEAAHAEYTKYRRTLSLSDATLCIDYETPLGKGKREYFVSYPARAMLMHLGTEFAEDYTLSANSLLLHTVTTEGETLSVTGKAPYRVHARNHVPEGCEQIIEGEGTIGFTFALRVHTDGTVVAEGEMLKVTGAHYLDLTLAANTSFIDYRTAPTAEHREKTLRALDTLAEADYVTHKAAHIADYSALYRRVTLDLKSTPDGRDTDERIRHHDGSNGLYELLFNFGRYLTIASSREGSEATTLQGIWNEAPVPPWQSNYTVNINTEMNYWPTLMCNLRECYPPLISLIKKISDTGRAVAEGYYHARGFVSHHNVDLWGMANPVGYKTRGSAVYAFWNLSSGWLCHHLYEYYLYTGDEAFLREVAYPIMSESARFYLDLLVEECDGKLILTPSTSPENYFVYQGEMLALTRYTTMSQSIVQNLFSDILKSADVLGIRDSFTEELAEKLPRLRPFTIGSKGQLLEWDSELEEFDPYHRHSSHMYGLYPGTLITTESTPELAEACRKSLLGRGDAGTGWGLAWKLNLWAKLKDGDHALAFLESQLTLSEEAGTNMSNGGGTYPNMLDAHPPFQIDGNFGSVAGIAQLLLQCEDGKIKLLPALPSRFSDGEVRGLVAHGGVEVDLTWQDGVLTECTLCAPRTQTVSVSYGTKTKQYHLKANERTCVCFE